MKKYRVEFNTGYGLGYVEIFAECQEAANIYTRAMMGSGEVIFMTVVEVA